MNKRMPNDDESSDVDVEADAQERAHRARQAKETRSVRRRTIQRPDPEGGGGRGAVEVVVMGIDGLGPSTMGSARALVRLIVVHCRDAEACSRPSAFGASMAHQTGIIQPRGGDYCLTSAHRSSLFHGMPVHCMMKGYGGRGSHRRRHCRISRRRQQQSATHIWQPGQGRDGSR